MFCFNNKDMQSCSYTQLQKLVQDGPHQEEQKNTLEKVFELYALLGILGISKLFLKFSRIS